jgi:DNA-binding NtrC family response regulator
MLFVNPFRRIKRTEYTSLTDQLQAAMTSSIKRVLFADDDPGISEIMTQLERRMGMEVTIAPSTAEAQRLIGEEVYDIAILDYRLLNGNSVPVYQRILSERPKTLVVFITGGSLDEVAEVVHRVGPAPVYAKPNVLNLHFLVHLLARLGVNARHISASAGAY